MSLLAARRIPQALLVCAWVAAWWPAYARINHWNAQPGRAIYLSPRPADIWPGVIQPWTAPVYLLLGVGLPLAALLIDSSWRWFARVTTAYSLAVALALGVYLVFPLVMQRPVFDDGRFGAAMMRRVFAVDDPANCLPSLHASFAVLATLLIHHRLAAHSRRVAWLAAAAVCVSTVTTGQHYLVDVLAGAANAVLCWRVAEGWLAPKCA